MTKDNNKNTKSSNTLNEIMMERIKRNLPYIKDDTFSLSFVDGFIESKVPASKKE